MVPWGAFAWQITERDYTPDAKTFQGPTLGPLEDAVLPLTLDGDGLWLRAITSDHRMILGRLVFHDVQEFEVAGAHMRPTAVVDAGPQGAYRRYELLGDKRDYYVVAAGLQVRAPNG
ncbi:hypothetical protein [Actinoplanes sp. NPDC051411]|uniref:hypothetical protein n=1 Tax=Actinoplanes sp. NPDC051411 TaxID=3155522 RepID=UPI00342F5D6D